MNTADRKVTASDLRAEIARSGLPCYIVGARVGVYPNKLSRFSEVTKSFTTMWPLRFLRLLPRKMGSAVMAADVPFNKVIRGSSELTEAHRRLIRLLAEHAVEEFLNEEEHASADTAATS